MAVVLPLTEEKENKIRLHLLVTEIGTRGLREYFDQIPNFEPGNLQGTLNLNKGKLEQLKKRCVLDENQWNQLWPADGAINSKCFDLTLLVVLLRNICNLGEPPGFDWKKQPERTETAVYHDVVRLKLYRNKYAHATRGISNEDFLQDWRELEAAILRIIPARERSRYINEMKDIQTTSLDNVSDRLDKIQLDGTRYAIELKKMIQQLGSEIRQLRPKIEVESTVIQSEINLRQVRQKTDLFTLYAENIKRRYIKRLVLAGNSFPIMPIELRAYQANSSRYQHDVSCLDQIHTTEDINELFKEGSNPQDLPIMIEAEAGVGKTTLLQDITRKWMQGTCGVMKRFKLVFIIPIRNVKSFELEDIICEDLGLLPREEKKELKRLLNLRSNEVLYLLDGLDERQFEDSNALLKMIKERQQNVVCTTRPLFSNMGQDMPYGIKSFISIKLSGFSETTVRAYVLRYFQKEDDGGECIYHKILSGCRKNLFSKAVIKVPLYTYLICSLWEKNNEEFPKTATELFSNFLKKLLTVFWQKMSFLGESEQIEFTCSPLETNVPPELRRILKSISSLAYHTLMEEKVTFTVSDVDKYCLTMSEVEKSGLFTVESEETICFRHKLFHEYFAGLMMASDTDILRPVLLQNLKALITNNKCITHHAFFFAAGLSGEAYEIIKKETIKSWRLLGHTNKLYNLFLRLTKQSVVPHKERHKTTLLGSFENQTLFESNRESPNDLYGWILETLPVVCSSTHSMVAALEVMGKMNSTMENKSITLVDNKNVNLEQMICILQECSKAKAFTTLCIINAGRHLCDEMMKLDWPHVKAVAFYKSEVSITRRTLQTRFPKLKIAHYDSRTNIMKLTTRMPQWILGMVDYLPLQDMVEIHPNSIGAFVLYRLRLPCGRFVVLIFMILLLCFTIFIVSHYPENVYSMLKPLIYLQILLLCVYVFQRYRHRAEE